MNKDIKQTQFNLEPKIPEIEMEMDQDLYPDLSHRDIGKQGGYGPCPNPEEKEGTKQIAGAEIAGMTALNPAVGVSTAIASGATGVVAEGVGKVTGNQDVKDFGEIMKDAPAQPIKDIKNTIDK